MDKVYEVCDTTDDEMYFPMGIFLSLPAAIDGIKSACHAGWPLTEHAEGYEKITVCEREIGMNGDGKQVYKLERRLEYNEQTDKSKWIECK